MPTIIALDVSLSMQRTIPGRSEENAITYHQLALKGISQLLEYLSVSKLEYVALLTYSSNCELKVDFTRDYDQIKQVVKKVEAVDKLCLMTLMKNVGSIFTSNWGAQSQCQVIAFTDCGLGFGSTSIKTFLQNYTGKEHEPEYAWVKTIKPVKWNFICLGVHADNYFTRAVGVYQQLLDLTEIKGHLYMPKAPKDLESSDASITETLKNPLAGHKSELGRTAMFEMIEKLCETNYKPYEVLLKCGGYFRLECQVILWPPPLPYQPPENDKATPISLAPKLEICGYLSLSDIGSPSSLSRHLIIPKIEREKPSRRSSDKSGSASKISTDKSPKLDVNNVNYEYEKLEQDIRDFYNKDVKDSEDAMGQATEDGDKSSANATPLNEMQKESMCALLHGALKVENLAALVLLNPENSWYGFLYSYADSKKKSNLMLNILPPGSNVIPWLGDLQMLGFAEDVLPGETASFPVKADKRSYSQSCVVWINRVSLQSDVQKVLRHAKKMPEKTQHFYKELNRIRRAALSIGFIELLEAMATLFDKEAINLTALNANPECMVQLKHASLELRKPANRDLKVSIVPVPVQTVNPTAQGVPPGVPPAANFAFN
ncbi:integrator complex subunit 14 [Musca domestica]|uniref:Integrator complex subunit 14 n=1 Tax=Musca domestica TaxID=7370 RepID=A0A1I8N718_MUSDO|nr:integrator complex subunit 14 [Musca domestica]